MWQRELIHYSWPKLASLIIHHVDFSVTERGTWKRPLGVHCRSFWEDLPKVLSGPVQGKTQGAESSADGATTDHWAHHPPQLLHVTVIWWRPLIWFLFWAQFKYEQHCFRFWESRSMDVFTQSHINYRQTLKITFYWMFLFCYIPTVVSPGPRVIDTEQMWGTERHPFMSSLLYTVCAWGTGWGNGVVGGGGREGCVWKRPPSQSFSEFGYQGNRSLIHSLFWLLANHLKSVHLVNLYM